MSDAQIACLLGCSSALLLALVFMPVLIAQQIRANRRAA